MYQKQKHVKIYEIFHRLTLNFSDGYFGRRVIADSNKCSVGNGIMAKINISEILAIYLFLYTKVQNKIPAFNIILSLRINICIHI